MTTRRVLLVTHSSRPEVQPLATELSARLSEHGIKVDIVHDDATEVGQVAAAEGAELVIVLGGDGTILRSAELAREPGVPLLGVNLGRVGFLAEAEREDFTQVVDHIVRRDYTVEERMTLEVDVYQDGECIFHTWALNEATVEKRARERMLELTVELDGRPLSTWGGDGVVMATPTGSTAYAFSGGGPVVWPDVEAILVVPISAHALFARPLVLGPATHLAVEVVPNAASGVMWCDGRRSVDLPAGARVEVRRSTSPVRLARMTLSPFTDRLVAKFQLPVEGWRGRPTQER